MAWAADYASGPIVPAALIAAGVTDVCRYLAPLGRGDWKRIAHAEYAQLIAAGLRVTLNWESYATDWLGGAAAGREHGVEAAWQAADVGYPPGCTVISSCDFDLAAADWPASRAYMAAFGAAVAAAGYRAGVYGPWDALQCVADAGLAVAFWQAGMSRAWSQGRNAHDHPRAHLIQRTRLRIAGTPVDRSDVVITAWGQASATGAIMTYAPDDLLAVRRYVQARTGLDANSVGISGDPAHASTGGYHEGNDDLNRVGQFASDYSKRESARDRPGSNAASALDIGDFNRGGKTLRALSLACVAALNAGDHRLADVREVIYTPDGSRVQRFDRLGIRSTGDSSHLFHTHISFFRDSEGRRAQAANVLGWFAEFFEGTPTPTSTTQGESMDLLVKSGDLATGQLWLVTGGIRNPISTAVGERRQALHRSGTLPLGNGGNVWVEPDLTLLDAYGADLDARDAARDAADQARDAAMLAAINAIAAAGSGDVDVAAIITAVNAAATRVHDDVKARFAAAGSVA